MSWVHPHDAVGFRRAASGARERIGLVLMAVVACILGAGITVYIGELGEGYARLLVLPALVALTFMLFVSRKSLLLLIILSRASADLVFEPTKISIGGYQAGVGGLVNAFVLFIAMLLVMEKPDALPKGRVAGLWIAFLGTAFLGVVLSPVKGDAIRILLSLVSYFAVFVSAFYFVDGDRDFRACVRIVLWSSVIPVLFSFVDIAMNWNQGGEDGFRLQSTFTHPNIFACYLMLLLSLALYMLKSAPAQSSAGRRAAWIGYMVLLVCLLALTKTRSAWIACAVVFAAYAVVFDRRYLVYMVLVGLAALATPPVRERLLDLNSNNELVQFGKLNSYAWRKLIWETGLRWMQWDHYAFGYGLDAFRFYSPQFFPLAGSANPGAHNVYVQWLFEVGIAGFLALAWLFGRLLGWMRAMAAVDPLGTFVVFALVLEYLIIAFSDNMTYYLAYNWYFWFIVGAACAVVTRRTPRGDARLAGGPPAGVRHAAAQGRA